MWVETHPDRTRVGPSGVQAPTQTLSTSPTGRVVPPYLMADCGPKAVTVWGRYSNLSSSLSGGFVLKPNSVFNIPAVGLVLLLVACSSTTTDTAEASASTSTLVASTTTTTEPLPAGVLVPDVVGLGSGDAAVLLEEAGFEVLNSDGTLTTDFGLLGQVASQEPSGGESADEGAGVVLSDYVYHSDIEAEEAVRILEEQAHGVVLNLLEASLFSGDPGRYTIPAPLGTACWVVAAGAEHLAPGECLATENLTTY